MSRSFSAAVRGLGVLVTLVTLGACGSDAPPATLERAQARLAGGNANAAIVELRGVLQQDANSGPARLMLGKALLVASQPVLAEVELRKALDLKQADDEVVPLLARALNDQQKQKQVLEQFSSTRLTQPAAADTLAVEVATAQSRSGRAKEARAMAEAVVARNPAHAGALVLLARLDATDGRVDDGIVRVDKALATDPRNVGGWETRGQLMLFGKRDFDQAVAAFKKVLEFSPSHVDAHSWLVSIALTRNDVPGADAALAEMSKALPNHPQTRLSEVRVLMAKREVAKAREVLLRLMAQSSDNPQLLMMAGYIDLELNSVASAIGHFQKAMFVAPESVPVRIGLARAYLRSGQAARATQVLEQNLARSPNDTATLSLLADAEMQSGRFARAEALYAQALKSKPDDAGLRTSLAMTRLTQGQTDVAVAELQAVAKDNKDTVGDMALISAMLRQKNMPAALKAIDALETKTPGSPQPEVLRAQIKLSQGDAAGARRHFEAALKREAGFMPALQGLALIDQREGKGAAAEARYDAVLQADPRNLQVVMALFEMKQARRAPQDELAKLLDDAIKANPTAAAPRLAQIRMHELRKDWTSALNAAQAAATAIPASTEIQETLGGAQLMSGDTNQAVLTLSKVVTKDPRAVRAHLLMALAYVQRNELTAAERSYRKVLDIAPEHVEARQGLLALGVRAKNPAAALDAAKAIQRQRPDVGLGYLLEGDVHTSFRNWDAAIAAYRAGLAKGNFVGLSERLYTALERGKGRDEAQRFADGWIKANPRDAGLPFYLGTLASNASDFAAAERYFQQAVDANPKLPGSLNNLAWVRAKLKRPDAVALAERAFALAPTSVDALDTLVFAHVQAGQGGKAVEVLRQQMVRLPGSAAMQFSLAKLQADLGDTAAARAELVKLTQAHPDFAKQPPVVALQERIGR